MSKKDKTDSLYTIPLDSLSTMSFSGYIPIDTTKQEIRLVTIEPAEYDDLPIKCTLSVACLKESPDFTALSYVWGDASITRLIQLNGEKFHVTENLFSALIALRQQSEEFVCWIDAICINQQDTSEKSNQVLLMGEIYRACSLLVIWLGDESDDSNLACSLIIDWGEAHFKFINEHPGSPRTPRTVEEFQSILDEVGPYAFDTASWDALGKLFERPWWRRIWVLQEYVKAQSRVFRCGSAGFFDSFTFFSAWVAWDRLKEAPNVLEALALQVPEATTLLFRYSSAQFRALLDLWKIDTPLPLLKFLEVLYQTGSFGSTDPKDKLYGILGLVNFLDCPIKPHYEWSVQQVYTDLFRTLLETSKKIQIMSLSGISSLWTRHTCSLPSWVPHLDYVTVAVGTPVGYKASGDSIAEAYISQNSLSLFAKGILHSSVLVVHFFPRESYPEDLDERISVLPRLVDGVVPVVEHIGTCLILSRNFIKLRYPTGDTVLFALFCLLTGKNLADRSSAHLVGGYLGVLVAFLGRRSRWVSHHQYLYEGGLTEYFSQNLDDALWGSREQPSAFKDKSIDSLLKGNVPPFLNATEQARSNSQCFFITQNEYFGIGPRAMRPDDKIFIPFGCDVPLVIRFTGKEYIVIGSCNIYGLMKGEIMEKLERREIEPQELEFI